MNTKVFENIQTGMPYEESPLYVDTLVDRCAQKAVQNPRDRRSFRRPLIYSFVVAAVAAAIVLAVILPSRIARSPIDSFLASISDEEAAMIVDWSVEDIPECQ
jgi:hypothetical protein